MVKLPIHVSVKKKGKNGKTARLPSRMVMPLPHLGNSGCLLCTKKVVSDSLGLVDFAIGLVNSVLILPDGLVTFFDEFNLQNNCKNQFCSSKSFWG